jgi:hypothetical protein
LISSSFGGGHRELRILLSKTSDPQQNAQLLRISYERECLDRVLAAPQVVDSDKDRRSATKPVTTQEFTLRFIGTHPPRRFLTQLPLSSKGILALTAVGVDPNHVVKIIQAT